MILIKSVEFLQYDVTLSFEAGTACLGFAEAFCVRTIVQRIIGVALSGSLCTLGGKEIHWVSTLLIVLT